MASRITVCHPAPASSTVGDTDDSAARLRFTCRDAKLTSFIPRPYMPIASGPRRSTSRSHSNAPP